MSDRVELEGTMWINNVVVASRVYVHLNPQGGLAIDECGGTSRGISIYPFNVGMVNALDHRLISKPIDYSIEGTRLGGYWESFGAPQDGDIDFRNIKRVKIQITHDRDAARYKIDGIATAADGCVSPTRRNDDWNFQVEFRIPRADIARLYGYGETAIHYFFEELNKL